MRALLLALLLAGCSPALPPAPPGGESPILATPGVEAAPRLTVLIPGALASVDMYAPARSWASRQRGLAYYRLPGMDGLALDHEISITGAAEEIARFARAHPDKQLELVGYSTGAAIALEAAALLAPRPVTIAAISPAPEHAGGVQTLLRGARDVASAATRAEPLTIHGIWLEYWKSLLYGPKNRFDPRFEPEIERLWAEFQDRIPKANPVLIRAHSRDLRRWTLSDGADLSNARIGFFVGMEDPVFTTRQTDALRRKAGGGRIVGFEHDGHLLLLTETALFPQVLRFLDEVAAP